MIVQALLTIKNHFFLSWFALLLFILGFAFSSVVEKYNLRIFKVLPLWFLGKTMKFASPERSFSQVFLFIFLFNSIAIFFYMMSGAFVLLPFIIAFLTGMNIGIVSLEPMPEELQKSTVYGKKNFRPGLISFAGVLLVPLLEVASFCISIAMGMSLAVGMFFNFRFLMFLALAPSRMFAYFVVIVPILFLSALLETGAIKELQKTDGETSKYPLDTQ